MRKGSKHSDDSKERIRQKLMEYQNRPEVMEKNRQVHLGNNYALNPSEETREKQRQAQLGRKHTEESNEKNRQAQLIAQNKPKVIEKKRQAQNRPEVIERNRQQQNRPEVKEKIRQTHLGNQYTLGYKHTDGVKEKLRQLNLSEKNPNFGVIPSEETRELIRQANLGRQCSDENKEEYRKWATNQWKDPKHREVINKLRTEYWNDPENHIQLSCAIRGISRDEWTGYHDWGRSHLLPEAQCDKLNERFLNSHFHHITKSLGVYIPKELHERYYHCVRTGVNMGEVNMESFQFINGGL